MKVTIGKIDIGKHVQVLVDVEIGLENEEFQEAVRVTALVAACFAPPDDPDACRECGCTDKRACTDGCWWVEPNLCSACAPEKPDAQVPPDAPAPAAEDPPDSGDGPSPDADEPRAALGEDMSGHPVGDTEKPEEPKWGICIYCDTPVSPQAPPAGKDHPAHIDCEAEFVAAFGGADGPADGSVTCGQDEAAELVGDGSGEALPEVGEGEQESSPPPTEPDPSEIGMNQAWIEKGKCYTNGADVRRVKRITRTQFGTTVTYVGLTLTGRERLDSNKAKLDVFAAWALRECDRVGEPLQTPEPATGPPIQMARVTIPATSMESQRAFDKLPDSVSCQFCTANARKVCNIDPATGDLSPFYKCPNEACGEITDAPKEVTYAAGGS